MTPNLDIAQNSSQDWSNYISTNVSFVVEKIDRSNMAEIQPSRGLKLKSKAIARKKGKPQKKKIQEIKENG